jgi:hypothetical protein
MAFYWAKLTFYKKLYLRAVKPVPFSCSYLCSLGFVNAIFLFDETKILSVLSETSNEVTIYPSDGK